MATYSHSRLKTHAQCPRKFLWHYVWNVRPPGEGVEAFVGKRVHETLEDLYLGLTRADPPPDLRGLLESFHRRWEQHWSEGVRIVRAENDVDHYRRIGQRCIERYFRRHDPFDAGTTLAVEQPFRFPVEPGSDHQLRGFIDRVDLAADGVVEVHDYKTGRRPGPGELEEDQQVGFYEAAARHLYPQYRRVRMVWHFLRSGTERLLDARPPAVLSALRRRARMRIERIEAAVTRYLSSLSVRAARTFVRAGKSSPGHVPGPALEPTPLFPARVGPLCRWCGFVDWCREGSENLGRAFEPPPEPVHRPPPGPPGPDADGQGRLF